MSQATTDPNQLATVLQQLQQMTKPPPSAWGATPTGAPNVASVAIPIKLDLGGATIRVYLQFDGSHATPDALMQLLTALHQSGVPLDVYVPKQNWSGGNNNGGWNGRRGGRW